LAVDLRVFGDHSLRVVAPDRLIVNLVCTQDLRSNEQITDWIRDQLLKVFRTDLVAHITNERWPILAIARQNAVIEQETLAAAARSSMDMCASGAPRYSRGPWAEPSLPRAAPAAVAGAAG